MLCRRTGTGKTLIYGKGRQERQLEILAQQKEIKDLGRIHFT